MYHCIIKNAENTRQVNKNLSNLTPTSEAKSK